MTPDHNALVGEADGVSRFLYATGFSGHGFLMGPAIGEVLRDLVLGRTPLVDVAGLSVDRFADRARPSRAQHRLKGRRCRGRAQRPRTSTTGVIV